MLGKITSTISKAIAYLFKPQIFIILSIILIFYFGFSTASLFGPGDPPIESTKTSLLSETQTEATYQYEFYSLGVPKYTANNIDYDFPVRPTQSESSLPDASPYIITGNYNADSVEIKGISILEYAHTGHEKVGISNAPTKNNKALCNVKTILNNQKVEITCTVSGSVDTYKINQQLGHWDFEPFGLTYGKIIITVPKEKIYSSPGSPATASPPSSPSIISSPGEKSFTQKIEDFFNGIMFKIKSIFLRFR